MPHYTQLNGQAVLGSTYIQGTVNPFEDYVAFSTSNSSTYVIQGDITIDDDGNGIAEDSTIIHIYRNSSYGSTYQVEKVDSDSCTFTLVNPYYAYGSFDTLPSFVLNKSTEYSHQFSIVVCVGIILSVMCWGIIRFFRRWF